MYAARDLGTWLGTSLAPFMAAAGRVGLNFVITLTFMAVLAPGLRSH